MKRINPSRDWTGTQVPARRLRVGVYPGRNLVPGTRYDIIFICKKLIFCILMFVIFRVFRMKMSQYPVV